MKHFVLFLFLLGLHCSSHAQAPDWQTALIGEQPAGGLSIGQSTATDASGNVYIAGNFIGTITLGTLSLTSATAASDDIFVAKWSPVSRSFVWAQQAGGASADGAYAVAVNGSSVYLTGSFRGATASFGSITLTNDNAGSNDMFVAKLTDAGNTASFTWALQAKGTNSLSEGRALAVSGTSVYVAGRYFATSSFGTLTTTFGTIDLINTGSYDGFVTKLTDLGSSASFTWAQKTGGTDSDNLFSVAVTGTSVYVAGFFKSASLPCGTTTLATAGGFDAFVAKLTDAGTTASFAWAQRAGGTTDDYAYTVAAAGPNIYITGSFSGTAAGFGSIALTSAGSDDGFIAKLIDAGATSSFTWAQQVGSTASDVAYSVAVNGSSLYITGWFYSPVITVGTTTLTNAGTTKNDVFVAKLTDAGTASIFNWAQRGGGANYELAYSIALSGSTVYVAGYAFPPTSFGSITIAGPTGTTATQSALLAGLTDGSSLAVTSTIAPDNISLYPNPAHTSTTVQVQATAGATHITLTLCDALGRIVRTYTTALPATGLTHELSLAGLTSGIYVLHVQAGATSAVRHLAVE